MANPRSAADLRAEIGRSRIPIYHLASAVNLHPSRLSLVLNEHIPLDPDLASRIADAIQHEATRQGK